MNCASLTLPRALLLAAYLLILFGLDTVGFASRPAEIFAITLTMAVTIALWGRTGAGRAEEC